MDARLNRIMLRFQPDKLCDLFIEQYKFEYGEKKTIEVVSKIENSPKVIDYINRCLNYNAIPNAKDLEILMNSIGYFAFSLEETLCLGALLTFSLWKIHYINALQIDDILEQEEIESPLVKILSQLIWNCSVNKYNKLDNFFLRFFKTLTKIDRENP